MSNQMREILGEIGTDDTIPGTIAVDGREYIYLENIKGRPLSKQFYDIDNNFQPPYPKDGALNSTGFMLGIPDGAEFYALLYHGDIESWRKCVKKSAISMKIKYATIVGEFFCISDGRKIGISQCTSIRNVNNLNN
ncbi:hypothetical protein QCD60_22375 [Pokkaliibacter sp. MBI-7]|uniref:hypothetical protein n=1 Tax=Pokkaliibacter sp. MBI-7 TaxID=3040600 RepID=UPI00244CF667|nr:hypothetical protein [Pokkaliibacter sp. MBI-7]MDH2435274.1 hypothetical protein [Pokkaliibacter sp. MBI-7]